MKDSHIHRIDPKAQRVRGMSRGALEGKAFDEDTVSSMIEQADVLIAHNAHSIPK